MRRVVKSRLSVVGTPLVRPENESIVDQCSVRGHDRRGALQDRSPFLGHRAGGFRVAVRACREVPSRIVYPGPTDLDRVAASVREFVGA